MFPTELKQYIYLYSTTTAIEDVREVETKSLESGVGCLRGLDELGTPCANLKGIIQQLHSVCYKRTDTTAANKAKKEIHLPFSFPLTRKGTRA